MAKLWHPYEQNFINHPKFLVLSHGAICLWLEGKNYCDMHLTDGLIPREALRTFRFNNRARVEELKTVLEGYNGPLWEDHTIGFKMHDYLNHNACRDAVLAKMSKADGERVRKKENQQAYRDRVRAERLSERDRSRGDNASDNGSGTLPDKQKQIQKQIQIHKEQEQKSGGGSKRPIYTSDRFVVFEWQLDDLGRMLGPHFEDFDLHAFFDALTQQSRTRGLVIPADRDKRWQWLQEQVLTEARRRGLPVAGEQAAVARVNGCFHNPPCANASQHTKLHLAETA